MVLGSSQVFLLASFILRRCPALVRVRHRNFISDVNAARTHLLTLSLHLHLQLIGELFQIPLQIEPFAKRDRRTVCGTGN